MARRIRESGVPAEALALDRLANVLADADVVVSCTGAVRPVVSLADVHHALAAARRDEATRPLVICDLGMRVTSILRWPDYRVCGSWTWIACNMNPRHMPRLPTLRPPATSSPPKLPAIWWGSGWPRSPQP